MIMSIFKNIKNVRCFHTFYHDVNEHQIYSFMLRKAVKNRNSDLINIMESSKMIPKDIKLKTFNNVFYTSKYDDVDYMVHNVKGIRNNLQEYISFIEHHNTKFSKTVEANLGRLEQELN